MIFIKFIYLKRIKNIIKAYINKKVNLKTRFFLMFLMFKVNFYLKVKSVTFFIILKTLKA